MSDDGGLSLELLNRLLDRDGDDAGSDGDGDGDGDDEVLFDEGDDLGDFDGEGDDLGFDDDLGPVDGGGDDGTTAELEGRIDELENEVGSLSSTVSTIRSENEEISNTVGDVEENVRKLLDIYEMVTRGVNPFVDDVQADGIGGSGGGDGGSLGLFDDDGDEDDDDLDDDIADADAEEFFDDDFVGDGTEDAFDEPGGDVTTTEDSMTDDFEGSDDSGKSFDELKNEYESGDADWAEEDDHGGVANGDSTEAFGEMADSGADGAFDGMADDGDPVAAERSETTEADDGALDAAGQDPAAAERPEATEADDATTGPEEAGDLEFAANTLIDPDDGEPTTKPYLGAVPSGYVGDLLVMEWLEYLVEESDVDDAARAVEYYRRIQWVGEDAADELHEFLDGFGDVDDDVAGAPSELSIDHHIASLRYISKLTGSTADSIVFENWDGDGGVPFGL